MLWKLDPGNRREFSTRFRETDSSSGRGRGETDPPATSSASPRPLLRRQRHHPDLGYFARQALRLLDDYRIRHGRLDEPIPVGELGRTIRVELNHSDTSILPGGYRISVGEAGLMHSPARGRQCRSRMGDGPAGTVTYTSRLRLTG
ncbi:hypothetical protein GCM10010495_80810 [Kitasatospora herbaricolor]|nr:hypothetical protein GCM10010495_80810 [Kitasatospora herbaricolor]